jgi:hypothetical protein
VSLQAVELKTQNVFVVLPRRHPLQHPSVSCPYLRFPIYFWSVQITGKLELRFSENKVLRAISGLKSVGVTVDCSEL